MGEVGGHYGPGLPGDRWLDVGQIPGWAVVTKTAEQGERRRRQRDHCPAAPPAVVTERATLQHPERGAARCRQWTAAFDATACFGGVSHEPEHGQLGAEQDGGQWSVITPPIREPSQRRMCHIEEFRMGIGIGREDIEQLGDMETSENRRQTPTHPKPAL